MKGIVGKKLGMTQLFDPETGEVTPVTVIEAGPCPVVRVKTVDSDGYEAVQLAFEPVAERKVTEAAARPARRGRPAPASSSSSAARPSSRVGEAVTVESVRAGRHGQGRGNRDRQGLRGHDQAPQLPPRPGLARLAQHPQARLDRRLGHALARVQGDEDGRPHGRQARHAGRADRARGRRRAEPAARQGRRARPEERLRRDQGGHAAWPAPKAPLLDRGSPRRASTLEEGVFGAEVKPHLVHETVRAEQNAARAGTRGGKSRGLVAGGRAKPWRQKGTGRARAGDDPRAALHGRRHGVPAERPQLRRSR